MVARTALLLTMISACFQLLASELEQYSPFPGNDFPNQVFFGDTHLHTSYSTDAGLFGNTLDPEAAYRFAKGEAVTSSLGVPARLERPLDFLVVSDHAENLGLAPMLAERSLDVLPRRIDYAELFARGAVRRGHGAPRLGQADEDVVNLVQMLFDALLEDDNLPVPIRALLARIQFPILRIALAERAFLADASHPARRFLNQVTRTGIGWSRADDRGQDRIYAVIESVVDELAGATEHDHALLESLNARLDEALADEAAAIERATERVLAKERERLEAELTICKDTGSFCSRFRPFRVVWGLGVYGLGFRAYLGLALVLKLVLYEAC